MRKLTSISKILPKIAQVPPQPLPKLIRSSIWDFRKTQNISFPFREHYKGGLFSRHSRRPWSCRSPQNLFRYWGSMPGIKACPPEVCLPPQCDPWQIQRCGCSLESQHYRGKNNLVRSVTSPCRGPIRSSSPVPKILRLSRRLTVTPHNTGWRL